jgi:crotonobetainyl-CoA:carnitine CoA-transferase CaiB-like acyl-CoA transferase
VVRTPITLSGSAKAPLVPAPPLGQDSDTILAEIGYDADAISALRDQRII